MATSIKSTINESCVIAKIQSRGTRWFPLGTAAGSTRASEFMTKLRMHKG